MSASTEITPPQGGIPGEGRFTGRTEFQQLVRDALARAAAEGWREIILSDATFEDWPLGELAVAQSLQAWSTAGRRCTLLARSYDVLAVRHPRFVTWRRTWSHLIEARACTSADPLDLPSALWSPEWMLQRVDPVRCSGISSSEPQRRLRLRESLNDWLARSAPAFPATTLGL
jgi:hypothetical protein